MNRISLKVGAPDLGAPFLRLQLIVNPALASRSLTGALLSLAAVMGLTSMRALLSKFVRTDRLFHQHG